MLYSYVSHLDEHYAAPLPLKHFAQKEGVSEIHFREVFSQTLGWPPHQYLKELRLQWAAVRLIYEQKEISRIVSESGFKTVPGFSNAFKKRFEYSPKKYRELIKQKIDGLEQSLGNHSGEVLVEQRPGFKVAFMRHFIKSDQDYKGYTKAWRKFIAATGTSLLGQHSVKLFDLSYNSTEYFSSRECMFDTAATVPDDFEPRGSIGVREIPAGLYAVLKMKGSFQEIDAAWLWFFLHWLRKSNYCIERFFCATQVTIPDSVLSRASMILSWLMDHLDAELLIPIREKEPEETFDAQGV